MNTLPPNHGALSIASLLGNAKNPTSNSNKPTRKPRKGKAKTQLKLRVVLVDDHKIVANGLRLLVNSYGVFDVIGVAYNLTDMRRILEQQPLPDVIIIDMHLGNESGIDGVKYISQNYPSVKAIALTADENHHLVRDFMDAGGHGFVAKAVADLEMYSAITAVVNGEYYVCAHTQDRLMNNFLYSSPQHTAVPQKSNIHLSDELTQRETEIIKLIAMGKTSAVISKELFISTRTVETHRKNIMSKLNIHNAAGIIRYALKTFPEVEVQKTEL